MNFKLQTFQSTLMPFWAKEANYWYASIVEDTRIMQIIYFKDRNTAM